MKNNILKLAAKKFKELLKNYHGFETVFIDDWRGYRFIYDIKKERDCKNGCEKCPLYQLVQDEKEMDGFTAGLYLASDEEKKFFGPQKFLNCKSFAEYQNCYTNFLLKKCRTKREIFAELDLVKDSRVIYTWDGTPEMAAVKFKKGVVKKALLASTAVKKKKIQEYLKLNPDFYKTA